MQFSVKFFFLLLFLIVGFQHGEGIAAATATTRRSNGAIGGSGFAGGIAASC